jgi:hypothetical protein
LSLYSLENSDPLVVVGYVLEHVRIIRSRVPPGTHSSM